MKMDFCWIIFTVNKMKMNLFQIMNFKTLNKKFIKF